MTVKQPLIVAAMVCADAGARQYMAKLSPLVTRQIDQERLSEAIERHSMAAYESAMRDAEEAMSCGMMEAAQDTFKASFILAGINAVKELCQGINL